VGDRVTVPGGRAGRVVSERLTVSNGSWRYRVELDGGGTAEFTDFELEKSAA
jgi:hypothetical protein